MSSGVGSAAARALAAAQAVAAKLRAASESGGFGAECAGLGCASSAASSGDFGSIPPPPPSAQAASFLASLAPPPPPLPPPPPPLAGEDRPAQRRRSGFDVAPPTGSACSSSAGSAQSLALAAALRMADALNVGIQNTSTAPHPAPTKSLDELLARDRARIAAAHERNQQYVIEKEAAAKASAKAAKAAAAAAAVAVAAAQASGIDPSGPAAKPRPAARGTINSAACSVYVSCLPRDATPAELIDHFGIVSPVVRVKLYKDAQGNNKGDGLVRADGAKPHQRAFSASKQLPAAARCCAPASPPTDAWPVLLQVTFDKEAAVLGAVQLLGGKMLRPGTPIQVSRAVFGGETNPREDGDGGNVPPPPPPPPPPPVTDLSEVEPVDASLRVVVVRGLFSPDNVPPSSHGEARAVWLEELTDDLWSECCKHGEVERITVLLPELAGPAVVQALGSEAVAIRFQKLEGAAAAVDALDGRFFAERELQAAFDDGTAAPLLPAEEDVTRQQRFGFGEIAIAYQDSIRVLRLAAAEGALFVACSTYLCEVDLYEYRNGLTGDAPQGAGYYRLEDAPPPDPFEQARAILQQAVDAGAAFVSCEEPIVDELPLYEYRDGPEGRGYYRHAAAPPAADPREQSLLLLREAASAAAEFVRCPEFVGASAGLW